MFQSLSDIDRARIPRDVVKFARVDSLSGGRRIPGEHRATVHGPTGEEIRATKRPVGAFRADPLWVSDWPGWESARRLHGTHVYLGVWSFHFGHFLCETLPMLMYAHLFPQGRLLFHRYVAPASWDVFMSLPWPGTLLEAAGFPAERMLLIDRPVCVKTLLIPPRWAAQLGQPDPLIGRFLVDVGRNVLRHAGIADTSGSRKIYLSRRRFQAHRVFDNEDEVENHFARRGFEIVYPESLPLAEQIALIRQAAWIAGTDGSALHLSMFANPGLRMIVVGLRAGGADAVARVNRTQAVETYFWDVRERLSEVPITDEQRARGVKQRVRLQDAEAHLSALWDATMQRLEDTRAAPTCIAIDRWRNTGALRLRPVCEPRARPRARSVPNPLA